MDPAFQVDTRGKRGVIVVWGLLAAYPFGGMTWQVLHYLVGFQRLGFDVWYVEDSDRYVYDPATYCLTAECSANVAYMARYLERLGMSERWAFRPVGSEDVWTRSTDFPGLAALYKRADAVINVCGAQEVRDEHRTARRLTFIQTDPGEDQVLSAQKVPHRVAQLDAHEYLFTYGLNIGAGDCRLPVEGYQWLPTRPPVCVDWWETACTPDVAAAFTTVANWTHSGKDVVWEGECWSWRKDIEFLRFSSLPARTVRRMELAVGLMPDNDKAHMRDMGWSLLPSDNLSDPDAYRRYIQESLGEFTVAKPQYVLPRTGWFSDRSVCYLAAGRPVITQDTGFGRFIPSTKGLLTFTTADDAAAALDSVVSDYKGHSEAARQIAIDHFGAERVVGDVLRAIGL